MWSRTRQKLEDLTCASLKGRVKFFVTEYRKAHDGYGRACFVIDGDEKYNMCFYKYNIECWKIAQGLKSDPHYVPKYDSEYSASWEAKELAPGKGVYADWHFFKALDAYLRNSIETSLNSENEIIKSFALIDRRTGKRTLLDMKQSIEQQTDMVKYFFNLRCSADGIADI